MLIKYNNNNSDWLMLTDRCVVIGCLLIDSCDTYHSMVVRFASPATRGFLSPLLSFSLFSSPRGKRKPLGPGQGKSIFGLNNLKNALYFMGNALNNQAHHCVFSLSTQNVLVFKISFHFTDLQA